VPLANANNWTGFPESPRRIPRGAPPHRARGSPHSAGPPPSEVNGRQLASSLRRGVSDRSSIARRNWASPTCPGTKRNCSSPPAAVGHTRPTLIALTGWGQQQDRQRTSQAGFDVHLVKPVSETQLRSSAEVRYHGRRGLIRPRTPVNQNARVPAGRISLTRLSFRPGGCVPLKSHSQNTLKVQAPSRRRRVPSAELTPTHGHSSAEVKEVGVARAGTGQCCVAARNL
jgi:CheY-like chemotaxis protein